MDRARLIRVFSLCGVLWALTLPAGAAVLFLDDFDGGTPDPARWSVADNGYPAPAVSVSGGLLRLGVPGTASLDFPYVRSLGTLFPAGGGMSLEVAFRYGSVAGRGVGLTVLDAAGNRVGYFWQDDSTGFQVQGVTGLGFSTAPHVVRWDWVGGDVSTYLDGTLVATGPSALPDSLWIGHPTIGQFLALDLLPASGGVVTSRWWGYGTWTTLEVDYVKVSSLAVPEPDALVLLSLSAGLAGGALRRQRRG